MMVWPACSRIVVLAVLLSGSVMLFSGAFSPSAARESGGDRFFAQSDCPRVGLRVVFQQAVPGEDLISAINREQQILVLCQKRQSLINAVLEREREYRKLIDRDSAKQVDGALSRLDRPSGVVWQGGANPADPGETAHSIPAPPPIPATAKVPQATLVPQSPDYSWYTLYGSGDNLTVGIAGMSASGGAPGSWLRQQGDTLPGGWRVESLQTKPVKITLKKGDQLLDLPYVRKTSADGAVSYDDAAIEALLEGRR